MIDSKAYLNSTGLKNTILQRTKFTFLFKPLNDLQKSICPITNWPSACLSRHNIYAESHVGDRFPCL